MHAGNLIAPGLRMTLGYADKLVQTIPAEIFSHMPRADLNSAGFCIGHLALYAPVVAGMLGNKDLGDAPAGYNELFKHGSPCVDRPGLYPSKDALIAEFTKGWTKVADILPGVDDALFAKANPMTQMADKLPTVGAMVAFMCLAHNQMHLGQISAWRRVMNLGSAM